LDQLFINWIGVHWSLCVIFFLVTFSFFVVFKIKRKPVLNPKIGEPVLQSLKEGVHFVLKTKAILGALTLDMFSVLFGGAIALLAVFAEDILPSLVLGYASLFLESHLFFGFLLLHCFSVELQMEFLW